MATDQKILNLKCVVQKNIFCQFEMILISHLEIVWIQQKFGLDQTTVENNTNHNWRQTYSWLIQGLTTNDSAQTIQEELIQFIRQSLCLSRDTFECFFQVKLSLHSDWLKFNNKRFITTIFSYFAAFNKLDSACT